MTPQTLLGDLGLESARLGVLYLDRPLPSLSVRIASLMG